jgi:hypothetical protein
VVFPQEGNGDQRERKHNGGQRAQANVAPALSQRDGDWVGAFHAQISDFITRAHAGLPD